MCPYISLVVFFFNAVQSFVQTSMRFFLEHLDKMKAEFSKKFIEQELIEHNNWGACTQQITVFSIDISVAAFINKFIHSLAIQIETLSPLTTGNHKIS